MKFLPQKLSAQALRIGLTFSLALLLTGAMVTARAGPYAALDHALNTVQSPQKAAEAGKAIGEQDDTVKPLLKALVAKDVKARQVALDNLKRYISARSKAELYLSDIGAKAQSQEIERSPLYSDTRLQSSNWLGRSAKNIWQLIKRWFNSGNSKRNLSDGKNGGILGDWIITVVWGLLFALVATFAFYAIREAKWRSNLKRKAKALLEEDEPERTVDEWLERANLLESQGLFREAVRCLYLACLLRFDEGRVARFERGQTNWEHLRRIQASSNLPQGLDFQPTTQEFDQIWYGMRTRGAPDVERFRGWYQEVSQRVAAPRITASGASVGAKQPSGA